MTPTFAGLIAAMWPMRNEYFGVRLTLRSLIRGEKKLRREGRL